MTLLESALAYAKGGWSVFPLHTPAEDAPCDCYLGAECASPGKHPRTAHGLLDATTDESTIRRWWGMWPRANIGIRTGVESELVVVDVDPRHGGDVTLARLASNHGPFPPTPEVATGGGGSHFYFQHPGGHVLTRTNALGPGLDLKADGGYVVAPPSLHESGRQYGWVEPT